MVIVIMVASLKIIPSDSITLIIVVPCSSVYEGSCAGAVLNSTEVDSQTLHDGFKVPTQQTRHRAAVPRLAMLCHCPRELLQAM